MSEWTGPIDLNKVANLIDSKKEAGELELGYILTQLVKEIRNLQDQLLQAQHNLEGSQSNAKDWHMEANRRTFQVKQLGIENARLRSAAQKVATDKIESRQEPPVRLDAEEEFPKEHDEWR